MEAGIPSTDNLHRKTPGGPSAGRCCFRLFGLHFGDLGPGHGQVHGVALFHGLGGLFAAVVIEAFAALDAVFAGLVQLLKEAGGILVVGQILPQIGGDVVMDVQTALVHHFQRTQAGVAEAQAVLHGAVDVGEVADTLLLDVQGLPEDGGLEAVGDKAQGVLLHIDGLFADDFGKLIDGLGGLGSGLIPVDDLDERHDVGGVEPVHTAEPLLALDLGADLGDGQAGGVGAE